MTASAAFPPMMMYPVTAAPLAAAHPNPIPAASMPPAMSVVDPLSRKLMVPRAALTTTLAMERAGTPSLCMLYLSGRCRQGAQCHQVHADPPTVMRLREAAKSVPTCCVAHGDANAGLIKPEWLQRSVEVNGVVIAAGRLAFTQGLAKLLGGSSAPMVRVVTQQVCRLHVADRCRYSEDCKFLHVCREEADSKLSAWVQPMKPHFAARTAPVAFARPLQQQVPAQQQGPVVVGCATPPSVFLSSDSVYSTPSSMCITPPPTSVAAAVPVNSAQWPASVPINTIAAHLGPAPLAYFVPQFQQVVMMPVAQQQPCMASAPSFGGAATFAPPVVSQASSTSTPSSSSSRAPSSEAELSFVLPASVMEECM